MWKYLALISTLGTGQQQRTRIIVVGQSLYRQPYRVSQLSLRSVLHSGARSRASNWVAILHVGAALQVTDLETHRCMVQVANPCLGTKKVVGRVPACQIVSSEMIPAIDE